ncbi:MAG: Na+/H+ antiporter NhaC family protein [bacterium JZ-2024 1]
MTTGNLQNPSAPNRGLRVVLSALVLMGVVLLGIALEETFGRPANIGRWYSILPPAIAVSLALATGNVFISLALGVLCGGILVHIPEQPESLIGWGRGFLQAGDFVADSVLNKTNLHILAFVVFMMAMISVILRAGAMEVLIQTLSRFARGPRSAQVVASLLGIIVFIDDYANTMIVGSAMRPLTDRYRISREKLAFIVDATSAPVAGIAVASTWIGYEVGLFAQVGESLGIRRDGYRMFFDALPFRFYCWLMIVFLFLNTSMGRDFGPMLRAQKRSTQKGWLLAPDAKPLTGKTIVSPALNARPSVWTIALPVTALFVWLLGWLWADGGGNSLFGRNPLAILSPGNWIQVMTNAEHNIPILATSAGFAFGVTFLCALGFSRLQLREVLLASYLGFAGSLFPITILVLAWSLKASCDTLHTGSFLVATLANAVSPIWLPTAVFILACLTSFATGTSWGTMAILLPITTPLAYSADGSTYGLTTMLCLAAVLDGAIFGDHCSPISDTTLISSISSVCDHLAHTVTQIPYGFFVATLALLGGYLAVPLIHLPFWATLLIGATTTAIALIFFGKQPDSTAEERSVAPPKSM